MQPSIDFKDKTIAGFKENALRYQDLISEVHTKLKSVRSDYAALFFNKNPYEVRMLNRDLDTAAFDFASKELDTHEFKTQTYFYNTYMQLSDILHHALDKAGIPIRKRNHIRIYVKEITDDTTIESSITDLRFFEGSIHFTSKVLERSHAPRRYVIFWSVNITIDIEKFNTDMLEKINKTITAVDLISIQLHHIITLINDAVKREIVQYLDPPTTMITKERIASIIKKLDNIMTLSDEILNHGQDNEIP